MSPNLKHSLSAALALALVAGVPAHAQSLPYGSTSGDAADEEEDGASGRAARPGKKVEITPYIEAGQVVLAEFSPGSDVMTYSVVAAGLDAEIRGRNNAGSLSIRYERAFGWGDAGNSDTISGVARFSAAVVPQALTIEAGALAARTEISGNGASVLQPLGARDSATQVYALYAGPSLRTRSGDVEFEGHYRIGYAKVESPDAVAVAPGGAAVDVFDEAVVHNAAIHVGSRAGELLPVGIGVGAGYNREDVSNLDQRVEDFHVRGDVAVPVTADLQLVGGVGWEKVEVSNRDAVRHSITGLPVVGSDGRFVTDESAPRVLAFETEGLIWDAGVVWRPSRRTALEAHVGKRYGSTTYYGSFAWAPTRNSAVNVSVYDGITGFGGQVTSALAALPTSFQAARNPITGELNGCVVSQESGSCLSGALGSVRSSVFRSRGVMATYGADLGKLQTGFGVGYDRRKFIGAPGTILALANGTIDENVWLAAYLNGQIDRNSSFATNFYSTWFQSGDSSAGDLSAIGASAAYRRNLTSRLSATAALGVSGLERDGLEDFWSGSASLGVRYSF
ncbi:MAG: preprotein translocase subunit YajC [Novosphingobium sp.]